MAKVKKEIKLSHEALKKFQRQNKKPAMRLGDNVIGIEYSEAVFKNKKEADKCLNSIECQHFMVVKGEENKPIKEEILDDVVLEEEILDEELEDLEEEV